MYRRFLTFLPCLALLITAWMAPPALALSEEDHEHAKNAFLFADRRDWSNAVLHARSAHDDALLTLIDWQYLLDADSGAGFDEITRFIAGHGDWPEQKKLRIRAEMALRDSHVAAADITGWFGDTMPITGVGKIALAEALMQAPRPPSSYIASLVRDAWRDGDFDEAQEKNIAAAHGNLIRAEDDRQRMDRLLWEEKLSPAKRLLARMPGNYQKLYKARMALIEDKKMAVLAVAQVDKALKQDPGLMYDRMRYRARHDDSKGVREILLAAPASVPHPDKWWRYRELQIRKAVDENNYALAAKLLQNHAQLDGTELADAHWLDGWLRLEFLNQPKPAYDIFCRMYNAVRYPPSRSRAAYWAGRAAEKSGDAEAAGRWYTTASAYPTTFYGQMGAWKAWDGAPLRLPAEPEVSGDEEARFESNSITEAVKLSAEFGEPDLAGKLLSYVIENSDSTAQAILAARLGNRIGRTYLSVRGAKKALRRAIVLADAGYPRPDTPGDLPIERALALSIVRQESEFDPFAQSPSGALGLMQLLPRTARETAKKAGMEYSTDQLFEPQYNIRLGSQYLGRLVDSYSGSYVMAIAAYNAGPGNVRNWSAQFGTPSNNIDNAVNWIERIPFSETRNYVQRVLENLQLYRHIEGGGEPPKLKLAEDLVR